MSTNKIPVQQSSGFGVAATAAQTGRLEDVWMDSIFIAALPAGGTLNGTIQVRSDFSFLWQSVQGEVYVNPLGAFVPNPLIIMTIAVASGTALLQNAVIWNTAIGSGQLPFYLWGGRLVDSNSNIVFTFTNLTAAVVYDIFLTVAGEKRPATR